ncbi:hypothetical protein VTO42DRAFT_1218 [Malbranchea cinnamomea]
MSSRRPVYVNPAARHGRCNFVQSPGLYRFHSSLPGYSQTPLIPLPDLAADLGVRAIFVKDESNRFGLPSFKVLGATWGCYRAITSFLGLPPTVKLDELSVRARDASITLVAATEGNHGRAVAFIAAKLLRVAAQIFVPRYMQEETRNLIAAEGAKVVIVQGNYDKAVQEAASAARAMEGTLLIQDTAFEGYEEIPSWIVEGYSTMMMEVEDQLDRLGLTASLMVAPAGVGSLAHAAARYCKSRESRLSLAVVEPDSAPSLFASFKAGRPMTVRTSATIMDGMNCGTLSTTAWTDLQQLVDVCVTVSCYEAHCAVQYLAAHSVASGPCGAASLAALKRLAIAKEVAPFLGKDAVVVLLSTEGPREYPIPRDVSVDDVVGLTQALTRIDSSNPTLSVSSGAGETEIADYLTGWFAHRDIECHRIEPVAGRPSVVGILRGSGGGKSLMFNGHVDTVSLSSYGSGPLSGELGERAGQQVVLGRGSLDMKGGLAAALAALASIKASGLVLRGDVIVAAVSDEEDASQGTRDLLAAGWSADAAVVPEPTMGAIATAHKGFLWAEVDILGVAAHGSNPAAGEDAILNSWRFLRALEQYQQQQPVDETLGQASLHCGLIRGGEEPSSYPAKCTITVEFRTIPGQPEESILRDLHSILSSIAEEYPRFWYTAPRITQSRPGLRLDPDHPLVMKAASCAANVLGCHPQIQSVPFWCDAALLSEAGIPSIVYGPAGAGLHSSDEWVEVKSLKQMERIFALLAQEFCS